MTIRNDTKIETNRTLYDVFYYPTNPSHPPRMVTLAHEKETAIKYCQDNYDKYPAGKLVIVEDTATRRIVPWPL